MKRSLHFFIPLNLNISLSESFFFFYFIRSQHAESMLRLLGLLCVFWLKKMTSEAPRYIKYARQRRSLLVEEVSRNFGAVDGFLLLHDACSST